MPSVPLTASMISGGSDESKIESRKATVCASSVVPTLESVCPARRRICPLGCVVVLPGWRPALKQRTPWLIAIEPVDAAERIVPADREAHLPSLAGRDAEAHRERAMLRLLKHVPGRARLVIAPLAKAAGPSELSPVKTEAVEPLAAEMVVDVLDIVSVGGDGKIAALFRASGVGRGEVQGAEPVFCA